MLHLVGTPLVCGRSDTPHSCLCSRCARGAVAAVVRMVDGVIHVLGVSAQLSDTIVIELLSQIWVVGGRQRRKRGGTRSSSQRRRWRGRRRPRQQRRESGSAVASTRRPAVWFLVLEGRKLLHIYLLSVHTVVAITHLVEIHERLMGNERRWAERVVVRLHCLVEGFGRECRVRLRFGSSHKAQHRRSSILDQVVHAACFAATRRRGWRLCCLLVGCCRHVHREETRS
ncbi:hypothetical protein, conserved [Leishmania tarentolae]|uniref:Uncharacterized protein n=1 Tax=Leishmania tarentolae TaxID=5689 RepID=A0A640KAD7_LEITA|nr:hypothetical protein, conserved [Leishmania tarentolae]